MMMLAFKAESAGISIASPSTGKGYQQKNPKIGVTFQAQPLDLAREPWAATSRL